MVKSDYHPWYEYLIEDSQSVELIHMNTRCKAKVAIYNDPELLITAVNLTDQEYQGTLFTTLNRLKVEPTNKFGAEAVRDADVSHYSRIFIDVDTVRPDFRPANDQEIAGARDIVKSIIRYLETRGFKSPVIGFSGNGWHLQYRVNVEVSRETTAWLKVLLIHLDQLFSRQYTAKVDRKVYNPARLCRAYGVLNRKGSSAYQSRPYRKSGVIMPVEYAFNDFQVVVDLIKGQDYQGQYQDIVDQMTAPLRKDLVSVEPLTGDYITGGEGDFSTLDVVEWFKALGLYLFHIKDGMHAVVCPWAHEHTSYSATSTVIYEPNTGWAGFDCKHDHCDGRQITDVFELLEYPHKFCRKNYVHKSSRISLSPCNRSSKK